ncbi:MAG TPA: cyclophilin-like fold protein [Desulfosporosinus sp.]|nr:cyclophilin-like fold protein [Desulfosporosinus sp.]
MYDNPASKDFLLLLPLTLTFEDYSETEKISIWKEAYLPKMLHSALILLLESLLIMLPGEILRSFVRILAMQMD